jgi:O-succinylbenzoate synthase
MRIEAAELSIVRLPLVTPFETSFGRMTAREFVLVALRSDGATGWGECVADVDPFYSSETTATAWHVMAQYLVPVMLASAPAHPRECGALWHQVRGHRMAKAALEMAAWDLFARQQGRPLCEVLGAPARPIASGVSIGIQPSIGQLVDRVAHELRAGYQRIKIKIKPGWDAEPVRAIREAFGGVRLMVDANAAYTDADAASLQALDAFDLMMIEQPLDYDDLVHHARLQPRLTTPICLDESIKGPRVAVDALDMAACRVINIKPGRMGGFGPSIDVHDACRARDIPVWHGGMLESGIGRVHNLHLSCLPGFTLPGDIAASKRYFDRDLIDPPVELCADGTVGVPAGPGTGVEPVARRLADATLRREVFQS